MSIQCVECANTEIYLLLVARNILEYISLLFIFGVLRHIALLVVSLVVARNWSPGVVIYCINKELQYIFAYAEKKSRYQI